MSQTFTPSPLFRNPHLQSIFPFFSRDCAGITFQRERIPTPDGDFLDLDFASVDAYPWDALPDDAPLVLALHGLEGSARSGYACELFRQLAARGIRGVGLNFRGCSGEMNRTARMYHSGETTDTAFILGWLRERFPATPFGLLGVSLGANVTLKLLGELGDDAAEWVRAVIAVSPPFDLAAGTDKMTNGFNQVYTRYFLRTLKRKISARARWLPPTINLERVQASATLRDFDNAATAPFWGFRDADDYYAKSSSAQFVPMIRVPTLIIRAMDDPFFDPNDIPHAAIAENEHVRALLPAFGGHVGFMEGTPWSPSYWAERTSAEFFAEVLGQDALTLGSQA
jgi:hypothetical protein